MSNVSPPPAGQYGSGPAQGKPGTSVMSVISLVLGIISIPACGFFVFSIAAVVLGFLGRREVEKSGGMKTGGGLALAGMILGIVTFVVAAVINILVLTGAIDVDYYGNVN